MEPTTTALNNDLVAEFLGNLSVLNLCSLIKELEQKWNVSAAPVFQPAQNIKQKIKEEKEQTEFNITLLSFPPEKKISVIKAIREALAIGLIEAKEIVEKAPRLLREGASKEEAELVKFKLTEAGANIEVK
jgi:large subunit ribosomal protein L7/L12